MVGQPPPWRKQIYLEQGRDKYANSTDCLIAACLDDRVTDPFYYWNDDFFMLDDNAITTWHRGDIAEHIRAIGQSNTYRSAGVKMHMLLEQLHISTRYSYELHIPIAIYKADFIEAISVLREMGVQEHFKRTLYGNMARLGGDPRPDVKITGTGSGIPQDADWVSSSNNSFHQGELGRQLRARFAT